MSSIEELKRELERETKARQEAEDLLAQKSHELNASNLELRESEKIVRAILNTVASGIVTFDVSGLIESANQAAEQMFGHSEAEMIDTKIRDLLPDLYELETGNLREIYLQSVREEGGGLDQDAFAIRKGGQPFPVDVAVAELNTSCTTMFVAVLKDMTKHVEMQRQLVQAQKLESIGQLAAGIAHEINTPIQFVGDNVRFISDSIQDLLSLIGDYRDLVNMGEPNAIETDRSQKTQEIEEKADLPFLEEELPKALEQSLEGVDRVAQIVRAMKEFSHPGGEGKQSININEAIQNTITVAKNEWKYVAEIVTEFDSTLSLVPCLPGEFNQVILNILVNAAHAIGEVSDKESDRLGTITFTTRQNGDCAEIRIKDTGPGIPDEAKTKIFDPFFTTKEVGKGTGQGLAIAHSVITEKHGGHLTFESEMGKGTTFIIRLPLIEEAVAEDQA